MRTVNSLLARYINHHFKRDSQALKERYKSPLISNAAYFKQVMAYIWLNRYKVSGQKPTQDPYCSAAWRTNINCLLRMAQNDDEKGLLEGLLDETTGIYPHKRKDIRRLVLDMLNAWVGSLKDLSDSINASSHTIGDSIAISFRTALLKSMKKESIPWSESDINYF